MIQRIQSKWEKTLLLNQRESLRPYLPDTRKYTYNHLQDMVELYGLVFMKPDRGTYGNGVMSIEPWQDELDPDNPLRYKLRFGIESKYFVSLEEAHQDIQPRIGQQLYLIQKGIHMLTYRRRKFDLRALVQRSPSKKWETTAFIGRVAAQQKIITNYHGGGMIKSIEELLGPYLEPHQFMLLYKEMKVIGIRTAAQMARKFPNLKEIGLDLAIDEQLRPWILEVNTLPALFPFKYLKDKEVYKKVRRYAVAYGRYKK